MLYSGCKRLVFDKTGGYTYDCLESPSRILKAKIERMAISKGDYAFGDSSNICKYVVLDGKK